MELKQLYKQLETEDTNLDFFWEDNRNNNDTKILEEDKNDRYFKIRSAYRARRIQQRK